MLGPTDGSVAPLGSAKSKVVQPTWFSCPSNRFANDRVRLNSFAIHHLRATLGDQGSQVRVLSPRLSSMGLAGGELFPTQRVNLELGRCTDRPQLATIITGTGTMARSVVPTPGVDSIWSVPPRASKRSSMLVSPVPRVAVVTSKPHPLSVTSTSN